jgi:hypothetical protein
MARPGLDWSALVLALLMAGLPLGCQSPPPGPLDDLPGLAGQTPDPARLPAPSGEPAQSVDLRQILIAYRGAFEPKVKLRWSVSEARQRIERLCRLARSAGQDFAALAKRYSDDPA